MGLNPLIPTCRIFAILCSFCYELKSWLPLNVSGKRVREAFTNTDAEPYVSAADFLAVFKHRLLEKVCAFNLLFHY